MMENHHHMSPVYGSDLEFYSTNSTNVKSNNFVAGNNNNISSDAESGFSINVSTGNVRILLTKIAIFLVYLQLCKI